MNDTIFNITKNDNLAKLLAEFEEKSRKRKGRLLSFDIDGLGKNMTVYNPTKPILGRKGKFLLARVEPKDSERSKIMFFKEAEESWEIFDHPIFELQDPFYVKNIHGWQILGGVEVDENLQYRTLFYRYKRCATELFKNGKFNKPFAVGPIGMKDIRLIELKNKKIAVFTRPQGGEAGLGKIGYVEINNLDELENAIFRAEILEGQFHTDEWGGANELHLLSNGKIGVLGHIAQYVGDVRHYYAMSFVFDTATKAVSPMQILATADCFPEVESKKPELGNIVFSGGINRKKDGFAELFVGLGDTQIGQIDIPDPFVEYEI